MLPAFPKFSIDDIINKQRFLLQLQNLAATYSPIFKPEKENVVQNEITKYINDLETSGWTAISSQSPDLGKLRQLPGFSNLVYRPNVSTGDRTIAANNQYVLIEDFGRDYRELGWREPGYPYFLYKRHPVEIVFNVDQENLRILVQDDDEDLDVIISNLEDCFDWVYAVHTVRDARGMPLQVRFLIEQSIERLGFSVLDTYQEWDERTCLMEEGQGVLNLAEIILRDVTYLKTVLRKKG